MLFRGVCALNAAAPAPQPALKVNARTAGLGLAAIAAAAAASASPQLRLQGPFGLLGRKERQRCSKKLRLSWLVVDALSGAVGEIAQLAVLYPLDTIKVRCQAQGANASVVLSELRSMGVSGRTLRSLYAGMGSSALCSAVIGALYLLAFYTVKRVGGDVMQRRQMQRRSLEGLQQGQQCCRSPQGSAAATGSQLANGTSQRPPLNAEGTHPLVASLAGVSASVIASVFEAPMETYKLRAQAGALAGGSMMGTMLSTAVCQGLGALYWSYGAFMIKSIPYDFAELVTYSSMCDMRVAGEGRQQRRRAATAVPAATAALRDVATLAQHQVVAGLQAEGSSSSSSSWQDRLGDLIASSPSGMGDMIIGAAAGAAAVLCSMPFDMIKTHMDLHHASYAPCPPGRNGMMYSASQFVSTGRQLMGQGGLKALFVGLTPRLLQTMPSTMVYWFAVESTRRALMRYIDVGDPVCLGDTSDIPQRAQQEPAVDVVSMRPALT
ncbi:hypothetical protein N2152v2_010660 [Parachlorella kessleri]